ncbi:hypothetical protein CEXT_645191 [Caerostris extrusa]|uniref:Uncharacterized protein n=1 Tax=Caerostris extrusa TaxID=172846 RepID=A0AAV4WPH6_CAEEX|nr:hypothetical protein CEXT_645191 [Caerostris extrusa]
MPACGTKYSPTNAQPIISCRQQKESIMLSFLTVPWRRKESSVLRYREVLRKRSGQIWSGKRFPDASDSFHLLSFLDYDTILFNCALEKKGIQCSEIPSRWKKKKSCQKWYGKRYPDASDRYYPFLTVPWRRKESSVLRYRVVGKSCQIWSGKRYPDASDRYYPFNSALEKKEIQCSKIPSLWKRKKFFRYGVESAIPTLQIGNDPLPNFEQAV